MKKKIWAAAILIIAVFITLTYVINYEGETLTKQGVLTNVALSGESSIVLTFADGTVITVEEDDNEDALEMIDYLNGWIGEEMVLEYTYYLDMGGYEIKSVSYPE